MDAFFKDKALWVSLNMMKYDDSEYAKAPVEPVYGFEYFLLETPKAEFIKVVTQEIESEQRFFNPGVFSSENYMSYHIEPAHYKVPPMPGSIYSLMIYAEDAIIHKSRTIYNVLDFLGDVGGLLDALRLIGGQLVSLATSSFLTMSLISQIFFYVPSQTKLV